MGQPAWLPTMSEIRMIARPSPGASSHARSTPNRGLTTASNARPTNVQNRKMPRVNASATMNRNGYDGSTCQRNSGAHEVLARREGAICRCGWQSGAGGGGKGSGDCGFIRGRRKQWAAQFAGGGAQFFVGGDDDDFGPG